MVFITMITEANRVVANFDRRRVNKKEIIGIDWYISLFFETSKSQYGNDRKKTTSLWFQVKVLVVSGIGSACVRKREKERQRVERGDKISICGCEHLHLRFFLKKKIICILISHIDLNLEGCDQKFTLERKFTPQAWFILDPFPIHTHMHAHAYTCTHTYMYMYMYM